VSGANSLRRQLLRRLVAPLAVLMLVGAFAAYHYALKYANLALDTGLYELARAIAQQIRLSGGQGRLDLPRAAVEIIESDSLDRIYYAVTSDRQGQIFGYAGFPPLDAVPPASQEAFHFDAEIAGHEVRVVAMGLLLQASGSRDHIVIQVAETLVRRNALAKEILLAMIVPQGLLLVAAVTVIGLGVSGGLRPLADLAEQIRRRHADDLEPLPTDVPIEVAPLTAALNRLFAELDEAQRAQQRFIADAAHQLRTPLATLQVQAERALRERDPAAGAEAVGSVLSATRRLGHLVHQLLTLARVEPAGATRSFADCDLAALARETTAHWVPAALEAGADLGYAGPASGIAVPGDPLLLRELLNNLVDNALKYARSPQRECHVTVGVEDGASPCLWVEDDGPGIPAEAREYVLERFSRLPGSGAAGSGLGLAIVREIAARHGATVVVDAAAGDAGTRIAVNFAAAGGGSAA